MFVIPENAESWLCGKAVIEANIGGKYEVYSDQDNTDNTQGCKVLGIDPHRHLIIEWKGNAKYAHLMNIDGSLTQVQILFHPKGKYTQVTVIHTGWGQGQYWNEAYEYYLNAWEGVLEKLRSTMKDQEEVSPIGVTGLGGTFFKAKDPVKLKAWYDENLGFQTDEYGQAFRWVQWDDTQKSGSTQWSVMTEDTKYFAPSEKAFMLNYRVGDLVALLDEMKKAGVEIAGEMEEYDYGKFGWVMDPEGNKIELWEPVDDVFDEYYDQ